MPDKKQVRKRVLELRKLIERANRAYYVDTHPFLSDREFDESLRELEELEQTYDLQSADSPTRRVGGQPSDSFNTVEHTEPMLSLDNTYNEEELRAFDVRVQNIIGSQPFSYVAELKFDGAAIRLRYEQGKLVLGATRGDGFRGDDITTNLKTLQDIPLQLKGNYPPVVEVRGEAYMEKEAFVRLNEFREDAGLAPFANPRNSTAGSLKMQDPREVARRPIRFFAFDLIPEGSRELPDHFEKMGMLQKYGMPVCDQTTVCRNIDEILETIHSWEEIRLDLPYETDGVVIKVNETNLRGELGSTSKAPRWAIAFKFKAEQAATLIESITLQVGRLGAITPVAELKPVELAGTTIRRASLHNEDEIHRKDIRPGDTVTIEKAGEIIPQVVHVVNPGRKGRPDPFIMPRNCPSCGETLVKPENEVAWRCVNSECPPQIRERILHFASRDAMDIDGLGIAVVDQLLSNRMIRTCADLYRLKIDQLISLERFADKSAENLIRAIKESRHRSLDRVVFALGIRFVGKTVAKDLASHFGSISEIMNATREEFIEIDSVGPAIAESVILFFGQENNLKIIDQLREAGVQLEAEKKVKASSSLEGLKFVLTGSLQTLSRKEASELIELHGGKTTSSVSKNTDYLLAGDSPGSKYDKAITLGIPVLGEEEFRKLIGR